jgi:hypothetical protein
MATDTAKLGLAAVLEMDRLGRLSDKTREAITDALDDTSTVDTDDAASSGASKSTAASSGTSKRGS